MKTKILLLLIFLFAFLAFIFFATDLFKPLQYFRDEAAVLGLIQEEQAPWHLETPEPVRAIYMTSWVAGDKKWRQSLVELVEKTELNSIVIDVKDYTGRIAFKTSDPVLSAIGAEEERIPDIKEFLKELHSRNIYTIARISVFQDPFLANKRTDLSVKKSNGQIWKDHKGLSWLDPGSGEVWDYTIRIAKAAEKVGFDELNFDYVRFPSDGNMQDIAYDFWNEQIPQAEVIADFFAYLSAGLNSLEIPLSVDLFGLTTWNTGDLNIGQILEYAEPYFDYLAPMVYPSHYPKTFNGFQNPANHPYEIIYQAMTRASERLLAATSTPKKLRPWLQDFDLGAEYTPEMVRKEKQAVYDAGLTSWMLWDPSNQYTREALD